MTIDLAALAALAAEIAAAHEAVEASQSEALMHAKRCGDLLIQAKSGLRHGEFMAFVERIGLFSMSSADEYRIVARHWQTLVPQIHGGAVNSVRQAVEFIRANRRKPESGKVPPPSAWAAGATAFYDDGLITLVNADSRDVIPTLPPDAVIVSDIPYNIGFEYDGYDDALSDEEYDALLRGTTRLPCVLIGYPERVCRLSRLLGADPQKLVAWVYRAPRQHQWRAIAWFGCRPSLTLDWWQVQQVNPNSAERTLHHPCQTPVEVMRLILGATPASLIVDPFCGSGSTLVAARQLGIRAVGIEKSAQYCAVAEERLKSAGEEREVEEEVA